MAYPDKGQWQFRNQTRDLAFWMRLDTIVITQAQGNGGVAILSGTVVDLASEMVWAPEDKVVVKFADERIFAGHIKTVGDTWTDDAGLGARCFQIEAQDYTAKLDDAIIRRRKDRKQESAKRRAKWLLSYMRSNIQAVEKDLSGIPDVTVEKGNFYGMSVNDALTALGDEARLFHYVDFDDDEDGKPTVIVERSTAYEAAISMNNVDPDYLTSFPFREFVRRRDTVELASAVLVEPEERSDSRWSYNPTSVAAYGRQERFVSDVNLPGPIAAENVGERALAEYDTPTEKGSLVTYQPGIYSGMKFRLTEGLHEIDDELYIVDSVDITAPDGHDASQMAHMRVAVNFMDRRRRGKAKRNRNAKGKGGSTPDTGPYDLVTFPDDVTPPALSAGSSVGSFVVAGQGIEERLTDIGPWILYPTQDDTPRDVPFRFVTGRSDSVFSGSASSNSWTSRPTWVTGCPGVSWAVSGWKEQEQWFKLTMPAHPASMAGIEMVVASAAGYGYATVAGMEVVVASAEPTALRQGVPIATLSPGESRTVSIPAASVPAEGDELWVGYRPAWASSWQAAVYDFRCGLNYVGGPYSYDVTDQGHPWSGYHGWHGWTLPSSPVFQTWGATSPDLGDTDSPDDAPWTGGNDIEDAGYEGDGDAWGITDGEFHVVNDSPAGKGISVVGNRADDSQADGVWSDVGWAHEIRFRIDALGDTASAGPRGITSSVIGEGEAAHGIVHLGDSTDAAGIRVMGPTAEDVADKDISVGDIWKAKFDTRSGLYIRGKLWKSSEREPAYWDVQTLLSETEDEDDRWTLWLRAGNNGTTQGVYVDKVRAFAGANTGQRIVKEYLGRARGVDKSFNTTHPFRNGTLRVMVNGHAVAPDSIHGYDSRFSLDFWPSAGSVMRATYIVR